MKKFLILLLAILTSGSIYSQSAPVAAYRVADNVTEFGINLSVGTQVWDVENTSLYQVTAPIASTSDISTEVTAGHLLKINEAAAGTNITVTENTSTVTINSSTGTGDDIAAATTSTAGVMTASDKTKLDGIESGAEVNLTSFTENFEESTNGTTGESHSLTHTAASGQMPRVSLNGATLKPSQYTFTTSSITIGVPVYQYDQVVITYLY